MAIDDPHPPVAPDPPTDPAGVVRTVTEALARGDLLTVMGHVTGDVEWSVCAADRRAAPWFGAYRGRRQLSAMFEALAELAFDDFTLRRLVADGDLVFTWLHVAFRTPTGRSVDTEEVQIWELDGAKVRRVRTLLDTAAVAAAFR
ncbi:MAG: nuclear transport factor 2 family protein [Actinomycetota bacterium]|jgi:ketosteroid isomerase-like protein|nr:nuclear transport factor 2 family protein [Actinomycetota bacterium]